MLGYRIGNLSIGVDEDKNTGIVTFVVGESLPENKIRVIGRYYNVYEPWNVIMQRLGTHVVIPKALEKYL